MNLVSHTNFREILGRVMKILGIKHFKRENQPSELNFAPEVHRSPFVNEKGINKYQRLIGILQWIVIIGRIDLFFYSNQMSRFNAIPKQENIKIVTIIY